MSCLHYLMYLMSCLHYLMYLMSRLTALRMLSVLSVYVAACPACLDVTPLPVVTSFYVTVKYLREVTPYFRKASIISEVGWELQRGFLCGTPPRPHSPQRADTRYLPLQLCYLVRNFRHPDPGEMTPSSMYLPIGCYHVYRPPYLLLSCLQTSILVAIMSTDLHIGCYHVYRPPYWLLSCLQTSILVAIMSTDLHTGCYHVYRPPYWLISCLQTPILVTIMSTDLHTGYYHVYRPPYWLLSCLQTPILVAIMSTDLHTG
uniref:Uncharacterized protein n=1 Tax=Timema douglasi TaxID=61478 RepID=A0A7R8ZE93_TIMDO|nr:unnamed protein product [Timema douglasi]